MSELRLGQSEEYLREKAKWNGLVVFLPQPNEVFLDIDKEPWAENEKVMDYICKSVASHTDSKEQEEEHDNPTIKVLSRLQTRSKSGNVHIYLRFSRDLSDIERIILQVCLGSDPVKELFSFIQTNNLLMFGEVKCECPVALFETPTQASIVEQWRKQA